MRRSPFVPLLVVAALSMTACGARLDPDTRKAAAAGTLAAGGAQTVAGGDTAAGGVSGGTGTTGGGAAVGGGTAAGGGGGGGRGGGGARRGAARPWVVALGGVRGVRSRVAVRPAGAARRVGVGRPGAAVLLRRPPVATEVPSTPA